VVIITDIRSFFPHLGGIPLLVWIVCPLLTLGIYHFVWYYKIHKEMLHFDPRKQSNPPGPS